ncbi:nucleoside diphosphate kinase 2, chloroplastic isoform X2 [Prosopis cineraria]|uniref:nucleoside diphosphate kinase 2, chloroplastic isoform X2 n=1 Tax=Prosopis cineraria TaxID=364024 RepID=UPI00240F4676|nr:nucleoside diphosphate kinase 2, chloroplastic isoform X2 [Prosopis cineraria]
MEALAAFGGVASTSSSLGRFTAKTTGDSYYTQNPISRFSRKPHLSAFPSNSQLFSLNPSHSNVKTLIRRSSTKPGIFLPHLVASLEQIEETYIMVKPDGVQRGFEHYKDLKEKPFFPKLVDYITSGPVVCMAWEGVGVVASARKLIGSTNPLQAEPGTIRGDLAVQTGRNIVHGSDSPENGKREIALWFKEGELVEWTPAQAPWLRE